MRSRVDADLDADVDADMDADADTDVVSSACVRSAYLPGTGTSTVR